MLIVPHDGPSFPGLAWTFNLISS